MLKTEATAIRQDRERYHIPKAVPSLIPIRQVWPDGTFLVGRKFSRTYRFTDINYQVASHEEQEQLIQLYGVVLNSLDMGATAKITLSNYRPDREQLKDRLFLKYQSDELDEYRREYNEKLLYPAMCQSNIRKDRFLTITVFRRDITEANAFFERIGPQLTTGFAELGSVLTPMDAEERLRMLHEFLCTGDFAWDGEHFLDAICPNSVERHSDYLVSEGKYIRTLYLKDYASSIEDSFLSTVMKPEQPMLLSIDILPIPKDEAIQAVGRTLLGVETNITNWQRRQNANDNYSAVVPFDMEEQRKSGKEFLSELTTKDQRMMRVLVTLAVSADSKEALDAATEAVCSRAANQFQRFVPLKFQQMDGLLTALPMGTRKIHALRTMITRSLSHFLPFEVLEVQEPGGIYMGINTESRSMILCNILNLLNQSMFLVGVPGTGKSFMTKELIAAYLLSTGDDILICDPEGEYSDLVEALHGAVVNIATGGKDRINAMDLEEGYGDRNPIAEKSQFIMSLFEQIQQNGITAHQKSIIDRCTEAVYRERKPGEVPTLITLRQKLMEQPEQEAKDLALTLELYTEGTLDVFAHETNVDIHNRLISFNIHDLGRHLKSAGLLTITDYMLNRVAANWKKGKRTHLFIDEFHVVLEQEYSADFFASAWRQFRKRNASPCAITQNIDFLLNSPHAATMVSNSEFVVMLNQNAQDRDRLAELLQISPEQMRYVIGVQPGCGLMKYGNAILPFENHFPKDTKLYELMTTKPGEGRFHHDA